MALLPRTIGPPEIGYVQRVERSHQGVREMRARPST